MKGGTSLNSGDAHYRYMLDRIKQLEGMNQRLRERLEKIEREGRFKEDLRIQYERETKKLKSEIERLKAPPLVVGTVVDVIDEKRVMIKSSTGPRFIVNYSQFIEFKAFQPGTQVGLNQHTLAVVNVIPSTKDPAVYGMEVIESPEVDYEMIGGLDAQIDEIREVVELPLIDPKRFGRIGIEPPKGVLLIGLPGTGKTLLAKAVAKHTSATFIRAVGSELVQKYIGEGARLVRELFAFAREKAPSIVFIDEIDAIAARRVDDGTSGDREVQRTMMQLLAEIDGFESREDVRIIGATNRPDILDPALLRHGRFDRIIEIPMPDLEARKEILRIHTAKMKLKKDIDFDRLVKLTENATGADLRAISIEAGMFAVKENKKIVVMEDFEKAIKKIMNSPQRIYTKAKEPGAMFA